MHGFHSVNLSSALRPLPPVLCQKHKSNETAPAQLMQLMTEGFLQNLQRFFEYDK
jgi:hypothetical protein